MAPAGNDEWQATFLVEQVGSHEYIVEAWIDHFLSWRRELAVKARAGVDVSTELIEGAALVAAAAARCPRPPAASARRSIPLVATDAEPANDDRAQLEAAAAMLGRDAEPLVRTDAALDDRLLDLMIGHADRSLAATYPRVLQVEVDRERARFGAWYEMFPRSWGPELHPQRHVSLRRRSTCGTSRPLASMSSTCRRSIQSARASGRDAGNALTAGPGDPGSPWAIGSAGGGHKAVEPGLGTLDDFDAFVASARHLGLEVALDLAYQCSPDHPYVTTHPEWFRHRPDGTIKYAENPPKKYQDIYPFDFETRGLADAVG